MKTMHARFPGYCARTGARILPGDLIDYHGKGRSILRARASTPADTGATNSKIDPQLEPAGAYARLRAPVSDTFTFASGHTAYRNRAGRCEDAPCCGCCTI